MIFRCIIQVSEHIVKKNGRNIFRNRATGQLFPGKSARLVKAENLLVKEFRDQWWKWNNSDINATTTPINYPVNIMMLFYFRKNHFFTKKGNMNKKIPDLSNLYQLPEDCLQKAGVIENDFYICGHDGSRRLPTQSELDPSYLELIITSM
jgi:hypothetical protein